jgi:G3E family GTPase
VSVTCEQPLDRARVRELLEHLPEGVVRAKGILWLADDAAQRTVYQRVGSRWSFTPLGGWSGEPRFSRLVVIGRAGTLDRDDIATRLAACGSRAPLD